jgi:hypothetical protein
MEWSNTFVIYRINAEGKANEVFLTSDFQKAKYWLSFIAQPGDVLCKTPKHAKHSGKSKSPEYWSHKVESGATVSNEALWQELAKTINFQSPFPDQQVKTAIES